MEENANRIFYTRLIDLGKPLNYMLLMCCLNVISMPAKFDLIFRA